MSKALNILIFPGGTEIGLEIQRALKDCKEVMLYSAGEKYSSHAEFVFEHHSYVPNINSKNWINAINQVIESNKIDYIFPAHDDVVVALISEKDKLLAKPICSPINTCLVTRYKSKTYKSLSGIVPVPTIYNSGDTKLPFPLFAKPDRGQGSKDIAIINSQYELEVYEKSNKDFLLCEYLPGEEYTIDCFSDRENGLLYCSPRERVRVRNGISMSTKTSNISSLKKFAASIAEKFIFYGAWFFQVKRDKEGVLKLLEVAPRIAGSMALNRVKGVNFPLMSIFEHERLKLSVLTNNIDVVLDRALTNTFKHNIKYDVVYVDLDDTIILRGQVNLTLINFLYQCINYKIEIILVTRHSGDLEKTLKTHRLFQIFDRIIHLTNGQKKSSVIDVNSHAIFIDDSFSERLDIHENTGVHTFDTSMVELLLDYKV